MDVFLIPVGPDRYELYCDEAGDPEDLVADVQPTGRFASIYQKFKAALARAEQERLSGRDAAHEGPRSLDGAYEGSRALLDRREDCRAAAVMASAQPDRRSSSSIPTTCRKTRCVELARAELQREADRHLRWIIIDGVIFVVSGALALVPGPNVLAYYFGFRLVGHYLSRRGAKQGSTGVQWVPCPSPALSRLRRAIELHGPERDQEVHQVAVRAATAESREVLRAHLGEARMIFSQPTGAGAEVPSLAMKISELAERLECRLEGDGSLDDPPRRRHRAGRRGRFHVLRKPEIRAGASPDSCLCSHSWRGRAGGAVRDAAHAASRISPSPTRCRSLSSHLHPAPGIDSLSAVAPDAVLGQQVRSVRFRRSVAARASAIAR